MVEKTEDIFKHHQCSPSKGRARIARTLFKLLGWRYDIKVRNVSKKAMLIVGPHTSNWDALFYFLFKVSFNLNTTILVKNTLVRWPMRWFWNSVGAFSIDRQNAQDIVEEMTTIINARQRIFFCLSPEGTRGFRPNWKNGFLRIAYNTDIPIYMSSIDYSTKTIQVINPLKLTNNLDRDMAAAQSYILQFKGKNLRNQLPL